MSFRIPNDNEHSVILGKTGEGKTVGALWQLSKRSITSRPWIIIDFKRDRLIGAIPHAREISLSDIPQEPGVFIVRPLTHEQENVETFLWAVYNSEGIGIFVDEGFMLSKSAAFDTLLMQGRSKEIPIILISQRPVWISRYAFSEASHHQVYWLNDARDRATIQSFIPTSLENRLPRFNSLWYDVVEDRTYALKPVPSGPTILNEFDRRLYKSEPRKVFL